MGQKHNPWVRSAPRSAVALATGKCHKPIFSLELANYLCYHITVIQSLKTKGAEDIYQLTRSKATCPESAWKLAICKLDQLDSVVEINELQIPPGNRLE